MAPINGSLFQAIVADDYIAPIFHNTRSIIDLHLKTPRFGLTNDFSVLVRTISSKEDKVDYVTGVVVSSLLVLCLLIVWCLTLILLKCLGRDRVGIVASGSSFVIPAKPKRKRQKCLVHSKAREDDSGLLSSTAVSPLSEREKHEGTAPQVVNTFQHDEQETGGQNRCTDLQLIQNRCTDLQLIPPTCDASLGSSPTSSDGVSVDVDEQEKAVICTGQLIGETLVVMRDLKSSTRGDEERGLGCSEITTAAEKGNEDNDNVSLYLHEPFDELHWHMEAFKVKKTVAAIRAVFLTLGVFVLVFSALFFYWGVHSLMGSVNDVESSLTKTEDLIIFAINVTTAYIDAATQGQVQQHNFNDATSQFNDQCDDVEIQKGALHLISAGFDNLGDFLVVEVTNLRSSLNSTLPYIEYARNLTARSEIAFWTAGVVIIVFNVLVIWLMICVTFKWIKWDVKYFRYTRRYIVFPLMMIMIILLWICACAFLIGAVAGSDFCFDAPDKNVLHILALLKDQLSPFIIQLATFYITGCGEERAVLLFESLRFVIEAITSVHALLMDFLATPNQAFRTCGLNATHVISVGQELDAKLHAVLLLTAGILSIFRCSSFNPIYVDISYNAICYNGVNGLGWIFLFLFLACVCSMGMASLRVAWKDIIYEGDDEDDEMQPREKIKEVSGCVCRSGLAGLRDQLTVYRDSVRRVIILMGGFFSRS